MIISEQKVRLKINTCFFLRQHIDCRQSRQCLFFFFHHIKKLFSVPNAGKVLSSESHEIVRPLEEVADKKGPAAFMSDISGYFLFEKHRFRSYIFSFYSFTHHSNFQF